jgi:kynureninase
VTGGATRADAQASDAADPIGSLRQRFVIGDPERIYLDGNSLGRLAPAVQERIAATVEDWGSRVVEGWPDWVELPRRVGDRLAAICLGARPGEVLVTDTTTVNLYKLAHAALDLRPGAVVTNADNFPTDRYVLEGVALARGRSFILAESSEEALAEPTAALVCLSHVDYRSGRLLDIARHRAAAGGLVLWDLSHSVGAVPIDCSSADLAVGCSYKYLNAGPGAPAFLYVRRELQEQMVSPIRGWFSQRDQFAMGQVYEPAVGIDRFMAGSPPVIGLVALDASLDLMAEAGIERLAAKGAALTQLIIELADAWLAPLGFAVATPRSAAERGSHVALRHVDAWQICRALIEMAGVVPDFRRPDLIRFGAPPIYTRFVDVWDAMDRLRDLVASGRYREVDATPRRIT